MALALPDSGLQVSLLFSTSSVRGSPPGSSPGGLGLEKGTRRRGLELRPGPSSSLLSGLEGPLDRLSPHGPPCWPRPLGPAPARLGPKADTSPGCSGSVGNRERASEWAGGTGGDRRGQEGGEGTTEGLEGLPHVSSAPFPRFQEDRGLQGRDQWSLPTGCPSPGGDTAGGAPWPQAPPVLTSLPPSPLRAARRWELRTKETWAGPAPGVEEGFLEEALQRA